MPYLDLVFFDSVPDLKLLAKKLGQDFIVCKAFKNDFELKQLREKLAGTGFKTCHLMQNANMQELQKFRQKADYIAVYGKNVQRNKFACSTDRVDFLLMPCSDSKKPEFDAGLARLAAENNVCIALCFSEMLNAGPRMLEDYFRNYIFTFKVCKKYNVPFTVFSAAKTASEARQAKDFSSMLCMLGIQRETALEKIRGLSGFLEKKGKLDGFEVIEGKEGAGK